MENSAASSAKKNVSGIIIILSSFLMIIGVLKIKLLNLILLFFTNTLFLGASDAKLILFFVFLFCFFLFDLINGMALSTPSKGIDQEKTKKVLYASISLLAVMSLWSYLAILKKYGLSIDNFSLMSSGGSWGYFLHFLHIHTFKPAVTVVLTLFGIRNLDTYSTELVFLDELPFFYATGFIVAVFTILLLIYFGLCISKRKGLGTPEKIFFCITGFGLLKAIFDGGFLWYEFILSFFFFCLSVEILMNNLDVSAGKVIVGNLGLVTPLSIFYVIYYSLRGCTFGKCLVPVLAPLLSMNFVLLGLFFLLVAKRSKKLRVNLLASSLLVLGLLLQFGAFYPRALMHALTRKVPQGGTALITTTRDLPLEEIRESGNLKTFRYTAPEETRALDLIVKYDLNLPYIPVDIDGVDCDLGSGAQEILIKEIRLLEGVPNLESYTGGERDFFYESRIVEDGENPEIFYLVFRTKGCLTELKEMIGDPNLEKAIINHLRSRGFRKFVMSK